MDLHILHNTTQLVDRHIPRHNHIDPAEPDHLRLVLLHRALGLQHRRGGAHKQQLQRSQVLVPGRDRVRSACRGLAAQQVGRAAGADGLGHEGHEGLSEEHGNGQVEQGGVLAQQGHGLEDVAGLDGGALLECLDEVAIKKKSPVGLVSMGRMKVVSGS
jgi:hypothetical protein